jgi:general L-amino acid transport system permease protein
MAVVDSENRGREPGTRFIYDPRVRAIFYQAALAIGLIAFFIWIGVNTAENLRRLNIASGFDFFWRRAGFDVSQSLIQYNNDSTYGRAFLVGLLNTLQVAVIGIVLATILGFLLGIARLSKNWLLSKAATVYIETLRNIPLLLQLLFWYRAVLSVLPGARQGLVLPFGANLNNRGLFLPRPVFGPEFAYAEGMFMLGIAFTILLSIWAHRRRMATGKGFPVGWTGLGLIVGLPLLAALLAGAPVTFDVPVLQGFNFSGGMQVHPEMVALLLGLVLYTATFIAEIVRAGILAVPYGQTEAAASLGLRGGLALRKIIIPQALRVIIPPLTGQYLNLTKNSSLAVAIGYPDLVAVFAGTVLNQTGQAVEVIFITMLVYLFISIATSMLMNWFNARTRLRER